MESCGSCGWNTGETAELFGGLCPQCNGELGPGEGPQGGEPYTESLLKWAAYCAACGGIIWAGQAACSECGWEEPGWG